MKSIVSFGVLFFLCTLVSNAQKKEIELYDLIKSLLPDSAQSDVFASWSKATTSNKKIKWKSIKPTLNNDTKKYYKTGITDIAMNGISITCGGRENSCEWGVSLEGNSKGFSTISISPDLTFDEEFGITPTYLFGKRSYKSTVIKSCDNEREGFYKIKIPGKKTFWLHCFVDGGTGGNAIYIECYFDEKDMEIECM